jgi:DNA-binding Xre family transcriptional regulator
MKIVYDRLWKLLLSKKISKTDLCNLTGISSRTMAKLSKNQSVNTDTLLQICSILDCQLSDIAEVIHTDRTDTVYETYLNSKQKTWENETLELFEMEFDGLSFAIYKTKEKAPKKSVVRCHSWGNVILEKIYPNGISPVSDTQNIFYPELIKKDRITVLLISGSPGIIVGLDNGIVYSARRGYENGKFYVMSQSAFKLFGKNQSTK